MITRWFPRGYGDGEDDPLGNVGGVIADPLEILADHQQIQSVFSLGGLVGDPLDEQFLDLGKVAVHHIVVVDGNCAMARS